MSKLPSDHQFFWDENKQYDLLVIGGGPAGSTVATLVAMRGYDVLLIEKEEFPRYQIGESLLPSTINGICRLLGVYDEITAAGFQRKRGGTFRWGANPEPWTFFFGDLDVLSTERVLAYQVERMKVDTILLRNAEKKGVSVAFGASAKAPLTKDGRVIGVLISDSTGSQKEIKAKFVADASGHTSVLAKVAGERIYSEFFRNIAIFGYYENGRRLPHPNDGNILSCAFPGGWFWYIPLSASLTSVGAVLDASSADQLRQDRELALTSLIRKCPMIAEYLKHATRVKNGLYGDIRIRKDFSYTNEKFTIPGLFLLGDAACFIDPLFSQGVHLATYSALLAARSINTSLAGNLPEDVCYREFEARYRREYGLFYDFLVAMYDMNQNEDSYFWAARSIVKTQERANEAFIRLVAGLATTDVALCNAEAFFASRRGSGPALQRVIDDEKGSVGGHHFHGGRMQPELFSETIRVQMLGRFGKKLGKELPILDDGLVPSGDGLHWEPVARQPV